MTEVFVIGVEGLHVRAPQVEPSWEISSFTHSCFIFATFHSHLSVSFPASSLWPQSPAVCPWEELRAAGPGRVRSLYPAEGGAQMEPGHSCWTEHTETSLHQRLKVKALLPVQVILIRALAAEGALAAFCKVN